VLCDFEAYCEVVFTTEVKTLCQINGCETVRWDIQFEWIYPIVINSLNQRNPAFAKGSQPSPSPQTTSITLLIAPRRITSGAIIQADSRDPSASCE
jgi:hypothetical protein